MWCRFLGLEIHPELCISFRLHIIWHIMTADRNNDLQVPCTCLTGIDYMKKNKRKSTNINQSTFNDCWCCFSGLWHYVDSQVEGDGMFLWNGVTTQKNTDIFTIVRASNLAFNWLFLPFTIKEKLESKISLHSIPLGNISASKTIQIRRFCSYFP